MTEPTRGWEVIDWAFEYLPSPDDPAKPLVFTDEQLAFVLEWYRVDDLGDYVYRRACIEASKGFGKSPLASTLALAEFCGPTAPAQPHVQMCACSADQAFANSYSLAYWSLSVNNERAGQALGVDVARGRMALKSNPLAILEPVTSSAGAREGQRITAGFLDETQAWVKSNGGHKLAAVLRRNLAKTDGRSVETCNAPELGAGSVAEMTEADDASGAPGIFFFAPRPSVEPDPDMSDDEMRPLLEACYSGAPWISVDRILKEIRDPAAVWNESRRFFFNLPTGGALGAVEPAAWTARQAPHKRELVKPDHEKGTAGEPIALGFDGSHSRDGTALIGATRDGHLFPVLILERPENAPEGWRIDRAEVDRAVSYMFDTYTVGWLFADPWTFQSELTTWAERWPDRVVEVPTNSGRRMAAAVDRFRSAVNEGHLTHDGDPTLRRHVLNARLKAHGRGDDGRGIFLLEKAGHRRYIDACVAAVLAFEAHAQLTEADDVRPMIAYR